SETKATRAAAWPLPERSPPAARSAREINEITLSSRDCGRPSKESSGISSPGGSSTPTTAAHMVPTAKRTTPPADFSSSQSNGVLNKAQGSAVRKIRSTPAAGERVLDVQPKLGARVRLL